MCLARGRSYTLPLTPILKRCDQWHLSNIADTMDGHLVSMAVLRRDLVSSASAWQAPLLTQGRTIYFHQFEPYVMDLAIILPTGR